MLLVIFFLLGKRSGKKRSAVVEIRRDLMSLLPYALRPKVVLRGQIVKRGVIGGNPFLRAIAMLIVGQGVYLRRTALRQGLMLGHPFWRADRLAPARRRRSTSTAFEQTPEPSPSSASVSAVRSAWRRRSPRCDGAAGEPSCKRLEAEALADIEAAQRAS